MKVECKSVMNRASAASPHAVCPAEKTILDTEAMYETERCIISSRAHRDLYDWTSYLPSPRRRKVCESKPWPVKGGGVARVGDAVSRLNSRRVGLCNRAPTR